MCWSNNELCTSWQVLRGTFYNEKVDVFSLGVVMWELLSYTPTIAIVSGEGALVSCSATTIHHRLCTQHSASAGKCSIALLACSGMRGLILTKRCSPIHAAPQT